MAWLKGPGPANWGNRLRVTLKLATSLDGRIATANGESRWITGEAARLEGRRLRGAHDGVLIGINTALADDPLLTCRGEGKEPMRVLLDGQLRLGLDARLLEKGEGGPLHIFTSHSAGLGAKAQELRAAGALVHPISQGESGLDVHDVLAVLEKSGLSSLMIEGGGQVGASFLRAGLVDALEWFRAGLILGADARPGIGALEIARLGAAMRWKRVDFRLLGPDVWERFEKQDSACSPAS